MALAQLLLVVLLLSLVDSATITISHPEIQLDEGYGAYATATYDVTISQDVAGQLW